MPVSLESGVAYGNGETVRVNVGYLRLWSGGGFVIIVAGHEIKACEHDDYRPYSVWFFCECCHIKCFKKQINI